MHYSLLLPAAVLAGALALGCDDSPRLTAPADPPAPSFRAERFIVGTGAGKFTFNASDGARGARVTHVTVHGTIDLVSGGQARVWATARVTFRPDGTLLFDVERVKLTPL